MSIYSELLTQTHRSGTMHHLIIHGQFQKYRVHLKVPLCLRHNSTRLSPFAISVAKHFPGSLSTSLLWELMTYCMGSLPNEKLCIAQLNEYIGRLQFPLWAHHKPFGTTDTFKRWLYVTQSIHTADLWRLRCTLWNSNEQRGRAEAACTVNVWWSLYWSHVNIVKYVHMWGKLWGLGAFI